LDPTRIALFDLADQRLAWVANRQTLLAQNIANADTPKWRSRDLQPFDATLETLSVTPSMTDPRHLAGTVSAAALSTSGGLAGERAPDGNAVSLDRELVKVGETDMAHALVTDLYKKYLGMFRTALGR
jgi:flagellar basal-body rod protein FlgB